MPGDTYESSRRAGSPPFIDFEGISTIQKSSRGATGDQSRRTRLMDLMRQEKKKSIDEFEYREKPEPVVINGQQVEILDFD